ncbi:MAG: phosphoglycerate dehydrogenase [Burkholderiaceae bacterium]|nr:phosphoglycerate dehydrogenase [Burkholderiaceae bacterium]
MDLLIAEPLEAEVLEWLDARHELFYAPRLMHDRQVFMEAWGQARAALLPPQVAVDARMIALAPRLRAIGRIVGGPENIDLTACTRSGVEVLRCVDAAAPAEAEFMLGALLALLRPSPEEMGRVAGRELGTCTVGLVGMNSSARKIARLLQALGSRVIGYDPALHASDPQWSRWGVQPVGLRELFEQSHAVCVQLHYYSRYRGLLGERALPYCQRGQVLVSVSPVSLFDEELLAELLQSGRMAAAWLDNVGPGPLEPGQPLSGVRGLLVTPRLASYTREARVRSAWGVARRVDEVLRSTPTTARAGLRRRAVAVPAGPQATPRPGATPASAADPLSASTTGSRPGSVSSAGAPGAKAPPVDSDPLPGPGHPRTTLRPGASAGPGASPASH